MGEDWPESKVGSVMVVRAGAHEGESGERLSKDPVDVKVSESGERWGEDPADASKSESGQRLSNDPAEAEQCKWQTAGFANPLADLPETRAGAGKVKASEVSGFGEGRAGVTGKFAAGRKESCAGAAEMGSRGHAGVPWLFGLLGFVVLLCAGLQFSVRKVELGGFAQVESGGCSLVDVSTLHFTNEGSCVLTSAVQFECCSLHVEVGLNVHVGDHDTHESEGPLASGSRRDQEALRSGIFEVLRHSDNSSTKVVEFAGNVVEGLSRVADFVSLTELF